MKVLFLYPNLQGMNMLPPGVAILSACLKREGFQVDLFDTTHWLIPGEEDFNSDKEKEKNLNVVPFDFAEQQITLHTTDVFDDFENKVYSYSPDIIICSATEDLFLNAIRLLKRVRKFQIPHVLGGVFATFSPNLALSFDEIDIVCVGEGEIALVELCHRINKRLGYDDVTNLWIKKKDGSIVRNPVSKPVNINDNPLPDLSIFEEARLYRPMAGKVYRMLPVETHRGCPFTCAFCNSPSKDVLYEAETGVSYFRVKTIEKVRQEIAHYVNDWGAEYLYFWADTFLAMDEKHFHEFCDMYSEFELPFWMQTRPETLKASRIKRLQEIGLHRISLGVEHGNEQFRRDIVNRRVKNNIMIEAMKIPHRYGVSFSVNNIIGFPKETRKLAFDTVELNRQIDADNYNCYAFMPFNGTPLRKLCEELGYVEPNTITRSLTRGAILDMPQFRRDEIEGLRRCFVLYVKFPKERWNEIRKAEALTPEGDMIFDRLRQEFMDIYYPIDENDKDLEA